MVVVPLFPEMVSTIERRFPDMDKDELNDVAAGYFNSSLGVGEAFGPIFASITIT
jgi:hypothetical protein